MTLREDAKDGRGDTEIRAAERFYRSVFSYFLPACISETQRYQNKVTVQEADGFVVERGKEEWK